MKLAPVASTNISSASCANINKPNRNVSFGVRLAVSKEELALLKLTPEQKKRLGVVLNDEFTDHVTVHLGEEIKEETLPDKQSFHVVLQENKDYKWGFDWKGHGSQEEIRSAIINTIESINAFVKAHFKKNA